MVDKSSVGLYWNTLKKLGLFSVVYFFKLRIKGSVPIKTDKPLSFLKTVVLGDSSCEGING